MELTELKSLIITDQIPNFLVFTGDDWAVQKIYVNQIAKVKGMEVKYIDRINDIYQKLNSKSFTQNYYCYTVRDDKDILTNEKLQKQLLEENLLGNNILILFITHLDKRTKAFKIFKDITINFDKLPLDTLKKYVKKEIDLSDKNCNALIEICEYDYGRILLEIDKIKEFGEVSSIDADESFEYLLETKTIYQYPKDSIFDFVDVVLKRKKRSAYKLLDNCYAIGESNLAILSVLYDNTKQLLQVQSYKGDNILSATGLSQWQVNNARNRAGNYSNGDLVYLLRLLQDIDGKIKTGLMEEKYAVEYILANVL